LPLNTNSQFKRLTEVDPDEIITLMNHPLVRRHMPLATGNFGIAECAQFIAAKERSWKEYGFGPWAFVVDGQFVGWGGLQAEQGEADLALVLHPDSWGQGKALYREIIRRAFDEMNFQAVTVLLPPTRKKTRALLRLGFYESGQSKIANEVFIRYRLEKSTVEALESTRLDMNCNSILFSLCLMLASVSLTAVAESDTGVFHATASHLTHWPEPIGSEH